jgi:hypothetical protein
MYPEGATKKLFLTHLSTCGTSVYNNIPCIQRHRQLADQQQNTPAVETNLPKNKRLEADISLTVAYGCVQRVVVSYVLTEEVNWK